MGITTLGRIVCLSAASIGMAGWSTACRANLIVDGGFESADPGAAVGATDRFNAVQSFDGGSWYVTQGQAAIDTSNEYVDDGDKSLFLTAEAGVNAVSQTLPTVAGQTYDITFTADADADNAISVLFGGIPVPGAPTSIAENGFPGPNPGSATFTFYTFEATADAASTVLTIEGTTGISTYPNPHTVELDDVSVTPTPEPATAAGVALAATAGLIHRRRNT